MNIDYHAAGKALENYGKEIQRVNNKLDKVLEKLIELEGLDARKEDAIKQINAGNIGEAINTLKGIEKDQSREQKLAEEEKGLRGELKELMTAAESAAKGSTTTQSESGTVSPIRSDSGDTRAA